MTRRPKDIGTATESAVVAYLQHNGFPHAERRALHGGRDLGDITGTPGLVWEVKGGKAAETAGDKLIAKWLLETELERFHARANYAALIVKRAGYGKERVGSWWAYMAADTYRSLVSWATPGVPVPGARLGYPVRLHVANLVDTLRCRGYGEPLDSDEQEAPL